jgi:hypothetical protein
MRFNLKLAAYVVLGCVAVATVAPFAAAKPAATAPPAAPATNSLPSWNDTAPKHAIVAFVDSVTKQGSPGFVPPAERIAVFDNDGTLWAEWPVYFQLQFAIDRVKALAPQHPEWSTQEPFRYIISGDMRSFAASGEKSVVSVVEVAHSGMTTDEFDQTVKDWLRTSNHPQTHQPYTAMVYKPMLELLAYLRANGFKTFIVSGGAEFMRVWPSGLRHSARAGGGSRASSSTKSATAGRCRVKLPESTRQRRQGKPVGIETFIGRRPIAASATPTATSDTGERSGLRRASALIAPRR